MASPGSPAEARAYILERLVGDTGEPDQVLGAANGMVMRALPAILKGVNDQLASPLSIEIGSVLLARFAEAKPADATGNALSVISSSSSPDALVLAMDANAIALLISALFGADLDQPVTPITRDLSPTEIEVATTIFQQFAAALNGSGTRSLDMRLPVEPAITGAELAKHILRDGPAVRVDFSIATPASKGAISLFMPQRVLLKHRGDAGGAIRKEPAPQNWNARFSEEVMRSAVRVDASMPLAMMTLGEVDALRPGHILEIPGDGRSHALLSVKGNTLFVCELGKLGQNYTVRVTQPYDAGQDLMDGLLHG